MRKLLISAAALLLMSGASIACSKGQRPYGGTGTHHAGGYCADCEDAVKGTVKP